MAFRGAHALVCVLIAELGHAVGRGSRATLFLSVPAGMLWVWMTRRLWRHWRAFSPLLLRWELSFTAPVARAETRSGRVLIPRPVLIPGRVLIRAVVLILGILCGIRRMRIWMGWPGWPGWKRRSPR